jgi:hypothetical protein
MSPERSGLYYMPNSAAVTSVTARFTTSGGVQRPGIVVYEVSGAATAPLDAGPVTSLVTARQSSITSGLLTTTNANDILIFAVDLASNQSGTNNGFVPAAGFTFPLTGAGTNARQAVAFEIVSLTQTNVRTSMSWGTGSQSSASQFIAFKGAQ